MKLTESQKSDITTKNQMLNDIKPILKSEFVGIDDVIDDVIDAIRPFYIFPKSLKKPLIVCLWGMTAVGKTHLIQRLIELLNLKSKFVRFDVGEYTGSDYKLRNDLSEETTKVGAKDIVFLFDEFQFGRTLNEMGIENSTNAMRPIWDLLDSGKICKWNQNSTQGLWNIITLFEKLSENKIEIQNGLITNGLNYFLKMTKDYSFMGVDFEYSDIAGLGFRDTEHFPLSESLLKKSTKSKTEIIPKEYWIKCIDYLNSIHEEEYLFYTYNAIKNGKYFKNPFLFKKCFIDILYKINPDFFKDFDDNIYTKRELLNNHTNQMSLNEIITFIKNNFLFNTSLMTEDDYSQSLIFCVGNIDEAYVMHESSDPDADADLFYEHSLKITIPKIKQALGARFRMEQIGRMGNNHIIYPAFNKQSYKKLIDKHIKIRETYFKTEFDLNMKFTDSMHDIIYKEGVFPSQGVRPLLSTFNTMIDSYVSKIISELILKHPNTTSTIWNFDTNIEKYSIQCFDKNGTLNDTFIYDIKLNIDKLRKSDFSENQAFTALHESGHAVISCIKTGLIPKDVLSKTAGNAEGFCRIEWPEIGTKDLLYKQIMVALGGIESEKLIFGDALISNGANSDLFMATSIASKMVKLYGMSNRDYIVSVAIDPSNDNIAIHDKTLEIENEVKTIIENAQIEVKHCLEQNKLFLLDLATHLSNNSKINQEELQTFALKHINKSLIKNKDNYYNFKDIISGLKQSEEAKLNSYKKSKVKINKNISTPISLNCKKEK